MNKYASMIAEERERQVFKEGWTNEHDDEHVNGEIADAAACYAATPQRIFKSEKPTSYKKFIPLYPWVEPFKKYKHDRKKQLIIAGALIIAELERLERLEIYQFPTGN